MKTPIAVVGGSGIKRLVEGDRKVIGTPYGPTPGITFGELNGRKVVFLPRHGESHSTPPHKVNYRANLWGLKSLGVERIFATNAVGAIDPSLSPGGIVVPTDLVDFTRSREGTFYEAYPVTHIDMSKPYCPTLREILTSALDPHVKYSPQEIVMACSEGPRYETPAEINMMRTAGCSIVGMTAAPETFLARELQMCYASICFVSNMAAGLQRSLSALEVEDKGQETGNLLHKVVMDAITRVPEDRKGCPCGTALTSAQLVESARKGE